MPAPDVRHESKQRVFVHVGPPKTGTTYLQSVLWTNKRPLRRAGVLVPGKSETAHFAAAGDLRGRQRRRGGKPYAGSWDRLAAEAREWPGTSVISCEWLAFCNEEQVRRAMRSFGDAQVHVVPTLRDLGRVLPAVWQEQVKNGKDFTMRDFLDQLFSADDEYGNRFWSVHDTRQLVGRWGFDLPPERLHPVTLPRSGAAPDELWLRFGSLFVDDPSAFDTSQVRANPGLDLAEAELLRRVNTELGGQMKKAAHGALIKQYLHRELTREKSGGRIRLPEGALAAIAEKGDEVITWLQASGYDVAGDPEDLRVDTTMRETSLPEDSAEDTVARAAVRSMAALLLTMQADGAHRRKVWRGTPGHGKRSNAAGPPGHRGPGGHHRSPARGGRSHVPPGGSGEGARSVPRRVLLRARGVAGRARRAAGRARRAVSGEA